MGRLRQSTETIQRILDESDGLREFTERELNTLKGEVEGSIKQALNEVLGGASEAYDTLKEIEEYIEKDEAGAAALAQSIARLETEKVSTEDIDSALSTESENPVQNKVVTEKLTELSAEKTSLNAKSFGAIGDGVTDDTSALEALFEAAYEQNKAVYIPKGTYMIRRSLPIRSNLELYGDGNESVIRKFPSVWSKVTNDITEGDEIIAVESVDGFAVGDQMFITHSTNLDLVGARHCSIGVITTIDSVNNTITFKSSYDSIKKGALVSQSKGRYVSTSCAIVRSWSMYHDAVNVKIHDITLDGNRQDGEPKEWFNAPIHFDPDDGGVLNGIPYTHASYNHIIRDCNCINSSFDGISDQGSSQCLVDNVTIKNCAMHGVHFGTGFTNGKVVNCTIEGNGQKGAAIFFCAGAKNVMAQNNTISKYYRGASDEEYGSEGTDAILVGNIFHDITDAVFNFTFASENKRGGRLVISNNLVSSVGNSFFRGDHLDSVSISSNVIIYMSNTSSPVIQLTQSNKVVVMGNICQTPVAKFIDDTESVSLVVDMNCWEEKSQEVVLASYDENDLTLAQVIAPVNGNASSASTIKCSDFIPIPPNATSIKYNLVANDGLIFFYREDKSYLGRDLNGYIPVTDKNNLVEGVVDLTQYTDVAFMRFNCKIAMMENCYVQLIGYDL